MALFGRAAGSGRTGPAGWGGRGRWSGSYGIILFFLLILSLFSSRTAITYFVLLSVLTVDRNVHKTYARKRPRGFPGGGAGDFGTRLAVSILRFCSSSDDTAHRYRRGIDDDRVERFMGK